MRIAFVRTKMESTVFLNDDVVRQQLDDSSLQRMKISPKAGSSSKNIMLELLRRGVITACEEWKFWDGAFREIALPGQLAVKLFPCEVELNSKALHQYLLVHGAPDIVWVEGRDYPPYLEQIFDLCPHSFKLVYSKDWRPWKIEGLERYDLCLVDEEWEQEKIRASYPAVRCAVWDKLIDYDEAHVPLEVEKRYDICYVAYLRQRKNHALLFRAMAKLPDRRLTCVCVGDDRKGYRAELERLAHGLNLSVHFTGEVSKEAVNRYINHSRIGVMCSRADAAPRAILEYMAADVPVLVNAELLAGTRYVGAEAGLVTAPAAFHQGIADLLDNLQRFSPRAYYLRHYARDIVLTKFMRLLEDTGCRLAYVHEQNSN